MGYSRLSDDEICRLDLAKMTDLCEECYQEVEISRKNCEAIQQQMEEELQRVSSRIGQMTYLHAVLIGVTGQTAQHMSDDPAKERTAMYSRLYHMHCSDPESYGGNLITVVEDYQDASRREYEALRRSQICRKFGHDEATKTDMAGL